MRLLAVVGGLIGLSLFITLPTAAQRPYSYEGYLRTIAQFRTDVAHIGTSQQKCEETVDSIADQLEQITLIELPDRSQVAVNHDVEAAALRERPCSPVRADQILSGLCPERMCPVSRPVPRVPSNPGIGGSSGDDGSLVGVGGGSGSGSGSVPPPGGGQAPPPGGGQPIPGGSSGGGSSDGSGGQSGGGNNGGNSQGGENGGESAPVEPGEGEFSDSQSEPTDLDGGQRDSEEAPTPTPSPTPSPTPTPTPTPTAVPANASENTEDEEKTSPWVYVIAALAIILITGAIVLLLWKSDEEERTRKKKRKLANAALSEGRKLVEEMDYREAVRKLFLATLLTLDEKGLMRYDTTQTNYELMRQEWIRPSLVPALSPVVGAYERVWYGLQPLQTSEYDRLVKRIKEIQEWRLDMDESH